MVPVVEINLHEPHAPLHHPPGHEDGVGKRTGLQYLLAIEAEGRLRLGRDVGEFGHARLHPEGHLILGDPGLRFGITKLLKCSLVQGLQAVERGAADARRDSGRIADVQDRIAGRAKTHPRVLAGQEAARPEPSANRLGLLDDGRAGHEHHERGQVGVERAQTVAGPGAEAGAASDLVAGLNVGDRRFVVDRLGVHRADETHLVGHRPRPGKQFVHPHPALALPRKLENRGGDRKSRLPRGHRGEPLARADAFRQVFVVPLVELRLVVEHVLLGRAADHVQIDDAFGLGGKVGADGACHSLEAGGRVDRRRRGRLAHERGQRRAAEEMTALPEEPAPGEVEAELGQRRGERCHLQSTSSRFDS